MRACPPGRARARGGWFRLRFRIPSAMRQSSTWCASLNCGRGDRILCRAAELFHPCGVPRCEGGGMRRALGSAVLLAAIAHSGCGAAPDLTQILEVETLTTGWSDEGIVAGQHKIVPTATFALKNVSQRPLSFVQLNAVFRQIGNAGEWSSA